MVFFFQAEDGIRVGHVTGVQTCALPIYRSDRKVARMKYLIHNWGLARFRAKVEEYFGDSLAPTRPVQLHGFNDGMGWHEQGDEIGRASCRERVEICVGGGYGQFILVFGI